MVITGLLSFLRARASRLAIASAVAGELATAAAAIDAPSDGAETSRVLLLPMGEIITRDGRRFTLDAARAADVVAASVAYAGQRAIPCDYDHQLVFAVGKQAAGTAPASGWIETASLAVTPAGIEGEVTWTAAARERLRSREYRYLSPSFTHDKTGAVTSIRYLSLVNDPAIDTLPAVAATEASTLETPVNYAKIAAALGLSAEASEEDILAALAAMAMPKEAMEAAAARLGLVATATAAEIATAAASMATPDPAKYVPIDVVDALRADLATAATRSAGQTAEQLVTAATEAGQITPAMRPWALDYAGKDPAGFKAWAEKAPAIVKPGAEPLDTAAAQNGPGLTDEEHRVVKMLGITPEAFAAEKKKGN
jgi:phage I-like protein